MIAQTLRDNWNRDALTDYQGPTLQYHDVARKIEKLHILFEHAGVQPGDKIALCGRNSSSWAAAFMAILAYGAVAVPILHEFSAEQIHDVVNHSDARLFFVGEQIWPCINADLVPALEGIIALSDYELLVSRSARLTEARENLNKIYGERYPKFFRAEHVSYKPADNPDELAVLNYTSGTTSRSKGVLIPYRALWSNVFFARQALDRAVHPGSKVVSILPMAHMYGMMFEFIYEFLGGVHIYFLTRLPSPRIIFQAFAEIQPDLIISVPLIIEKIIRKEVLPKLQTPALKLLLRLPYISDKICERIRQQLQQAFGGRFYEIIVGGAAFNSEIEELLHRIGFNYTVGYGATECAPIVSYSDWKELPLGSCGSATPNIEVRIDSRAPQHEVGEILVRGMNVMLGYYKNPEATAQAIDAEGWYHTGDLGVMDAEGHIFIRGRSKNMLLGASGQNIYPEEIEDKLMTLPFVNECVIVQRGDQLVGLVYPDVEEARQQGLDDQMLRAQMEQNRKDLNLMVNHYERISAIELQDAEFQKTAKRSIKRFLYK